MTIDDLIARLEEYRDDLGGETEVRLMTQKEYPFQNTIKGLCSSGEMVEDDDEDEVLYLVEGKQLGYGSKTAWKAAS